MVIGRYEGSRVTVNTIISTVPSLQAHSDGLESRNDFTFRGARIMFACLTSTFFCSESSYRFRNSIPAT